MNREETLIQTDDVRVRVMVLAPGETTAWHHHNEITDHMVGLSGSLQVQLQSPAQSLSLASGSRCEVAPGRVHRVVNLDLTKSASYLLAQGVGRYDFNRQEP